MLNMGVLFCDHRNQFLGYFSGLVMQDKRQDLLVIYCFVQKRDIEKDLSSRYLVSLFGQMEFQAQQNIGIL